MNICIVIWNGSPLYPSKLIEILLRNEIDYHPNASIYISLFKHLSYFTSYGLKTVTGRISNNNLFRTTPSTKVSACLHHCPNVSYPIRTSISSPWWVSQWKPVLSFGGPQYVSVCPTYERQIIFWLFLSLCLTSLSIVLFIFIHMAENFIISSLVFR